MKYFLEPSRIFSIPGDLSLRVVPIVLLYERDASLEIDLTREIGYYLTISDRIESWSGSREIEITTRLALDDSLYLCHEFYIEHRLHSQIDPIIEGCTVSIIGSDPESIISFYGEILDLRLGYACLHVDLDPTHDISIVIDVEHLCIDGIHIVETLPECLIAMSETIIFELISEFPVGWYLTIAPLIGDGVDIKSCPTTDDRYFSCIMETRDDGLGSVSVVDYRICGIDIDHIEEMMGDTSHFSSCHLACTDIEPAVYLSCITGDDLGVEICSHIDRESSFATSSRTIDDDDFCFLRGYFSEDIDFILERFVHRRSVLYW
jgi:hypothetical protein